jgi:hypothetical protein
MPQFYRDALFTGAQSAMNRVDTSDRPTLTGIGGDGDLFYSVTVADMQKEGEDGHGEIGVGDIVESGQIIFPVEGSAPVVRQFDRNSEDRALRTNWNARDDLQAFVNTGNVSTPE